MSTIIDERYELSLNRIKEISENPEVDEAFRGYFSFVARFILMISAPSYDKEYNNYNNPNPTPVRSVIITIVRISRIIHKNTPFYSPQTSLSIC